MGIRSWGPEQFGQAAERAAQRHGLDPSIFRRQMSTESIGFRRDVVFGSTASPAGAQGIAQFMPATARGLGINPLHPRQALDAAAKLMAGYVKQYGSYDAALRAYNAGPGAIAASKGYAETNNYVRTILRGHDPGKLGAPQKNVPGVRARPGVSRVSAPQAAGGDGTQPDLGAGSDILTRVATMLQGSRAGAGVGASAPALPAFAAGPATAGALQAPSGGSPAARSAGLSDALAQVAGSVDTSLAARAAQGGGQAPGAAPARGPGVQGRTLYIGDSLGVGTEPNLKKLLGGHVDANVIGGRSSADGIKALRGMIGRRGYRNLVLDLGTNDMTAKQLEQSVRAASRLAPDRVQIFIPTLNGPFATRQKNAVLHRLAAADPRITLVPWHSHSSGHLAGDGIHATSSGYETRAQLVAQALGWAPQAQQQSTGGGGVRSLIHPHGHWNGAEGPTVALFKTLGKPLGLTVVSNKRHNTNPYSGSRSDHDYGNKDAYAIDASNGSSPTPQMDEYAYRLMHALGFKDYRKGTPINTSQGVTTINGLVFQVIYRGSGRAYGGNHLNHVHLGVHRVR